VIERLKAGVKTTEKRGREKERRNEAKRGTRKKGDLTQIVNFLVCDVCKPPLQFLQDLQLRWLSQSMMELANPAGCFHQFPHAETYTSIRITTAN